MFSIDYEVVVKYNGDILKLEKSKDEKLEIEFIVGEDEKLLNINIWPDFVDDFSIYLVSPSKVQTQPISLTSGQIKNIIGLTKIKGYFYPIAPYSSSTRVMIQMSSTKSISPGIWKLIFVPMSRITGKKYIYISTSEGISKGTRFLKSDINLDSMAQTNQEEIIRYRNLKRYKLIKKYKTRKYENKATNLKFGLNIIHSPGFEEDLKKLNIPSRYYKISDNFGIVFIDEDSLNYLPNIVNLKSVLRFEYNVRLALLGEISKGISQGVVATEDIGANFFENNPNISITGRGVAICIVDSGIDYLHEDFIYPDETSKILYLWDQTKEGNPPEGFFIGTEYTREDINRAIANQDSSLSKDEEGHGTMISGICAGLGRKNSEYSGVAKEADLIVVKLAKIEGEYTGANLLAAVQYLYKKSYAEKIPIIINLSIGSNNLAGRTYEQIVQQTFFLQGICTVSAAGNEGNAQTHTSGKIEFNGQQKDIELELLQDEDTIQIDIWIDRPDKVTVSLVSPTGQESKVLALQSYKVVTGLFDLEATDYLITYIYPTKYSGQEKITVNLNRAKKGIWKIRLIGEYITNGTYQAYLPNRVFLKQGTKFRETDPLYTINYPGTYDADMTVGAYDTINNSLWSKSSRGPTIAGTQKPDIVAPGVNIIAPYPGNTYATITGTAPAAAHVSGAAALYMQYVLVDGIYPSKSFSQKMKTYIKAGAKRSIDITYPNNDYGYGILDIKGIFDQLK
ncbi:S8 family serine peptidase [Romboutsia sp.]|uniref:S8 family serine peptidase n=1 Tax=Romboutsia sp. TaxID=1965302 RepID=UPI002C5214B0|nr:S8 family serine peptidase [Romboutsia sp.]HSQ89008.1 S8 family serine peptidase [Romboutsia sp.]